MPRADFSNAQRRYPVARLISYDKLPCEYPFSCLDWKSQTLMSDPLPLLNGLRSSAQGHEVALDDMLGIVRVQPERHGPREMIRFEGIMTTGHQTALLVHRNRLRQRGGLGQRWKISRQTC